MPVDIQIEGVSYIGGTNANGKWWVDFESVQVDQDIAVQQTTAEFDVWVRNNFAPGSYNYAIGRPRAGQEVIFLNAAGVREFGGVLLTVEEEEVMDNTMVYHCQCGDYTKWFDRHLVNNTYQANTTVQQLIQDIVDTYVNTPGNSRTFTTNGVQQSPLVPLPILQFVYMPPSQVLGQLQQMLGWGFFIDFYRDVNFYSTEYAVSPLPNNTLNADDLFTNPSLSASDLPNWVNLTISEDASQVKNQVFITGIYVAQQQLYTESFVADGQQTIFTLGYQPPNDVSNITVSVNGTLQQIALDLVDGGPGGPCEAQTAYVNFSAQTVRFCNPPAQGAVVKVTYYPMTQTVVGVTDPQSQKYMAAITGTDGVFQYNRMDPSLSAELPSLAQTRATMTLTKYAYPIIQGSFISYLPGWRVGQYFYLQSQRRFNGDLNGKKLFVTRVQKRLVQTDDTGEWLWQYTVNFASSPFEL